MPLLQTGIEVGGALVQGVLDQAFAKRNADRQLEANKKLADYQYSKDLEMWNKGNAYNSPEEQMKRLKAAGLNPALVYGPGAVGNNTSQLPKYQSPTADFSKLGNPIQLQNSLNNLGMFLDLKTKSATIDNLKADKELKEADLVSKGLTQTAQEIGIKTAEEDLMQKLRMNPYSKEAAVLNISKGIQDISIGRERWDSDKMMRKSILETQESTRERNRFLNKLSASQVTGSNLENKIKQLDMDIKEYSAALARQGIDPKSPQWQAAIQKFIKETLDLDIKDPNAFMDFMKEMEDMFLP